MPRVRKGVKAKAAAAAVAAAKIVAKEEKLRGTQHRASAPILSTADRDPPADETVIISTEGDAAATREPVVVLSGPDAIRQMETEAFMNELVEVVVEMSDKDGAAMFIYAGHNGKRQYLERDKPQAIKRCFLYSLLQARTRVGKCEFGRVPGAGEYNRLKFMASPTHSVRVLRDKNPKGADWLEYQLTHA